MKIQNIFGKLRAKGVAIKAAAGVAVMGAASAAHAELPAWATAMFADISGGVDDTMTAVMPIAALVILSFVILRVARRGANKI